MKHVWVVVDGLQSWPVRVYGLLPRADEKTHMHWCQADRLDLGYRLGTSLGLAYTSGWGCTSVTGVTFFAAGWAHCWEVFSRLTLMVDDRSQLEQLLSHRRMLRNGHRQTQWQAVPFRSVHTEFRLVWGHVKHMLQAGHFVVGLLPILTGRHHTVEWPLLSRCSSEGLECLTRLFWGSAEHLAGLGPTPTPFLSVSILSGA